MTTPRAIHARLLGEHAELDGALERLIEAFGSGDRDVARIALRELDERLRAHLGLEEEIFLPAFSDFDPVEAERLRDEHRAIRATVDELVIGSDLHLTRLPMIRELADRLRAHARREDAGLYRWIDQTYGDQEPAPTTQPADQPPAAT